MPALAERRVEKLNPRDPDAAPIVKTEAFDPKTGERVAKGWKRRPSIDKGYPNFTIPPPDSIALGLSPQFAMSRPGRYFKPEDHAGTVY